MTPVILHGNVIVDDVHELTSSLVPGQPNYSHRHYRSLGAIGNVARALQCGGIEPHLDCVVGSDDDGQWCLKEFSRLGSLYPNMNLYWNTSVATVLVTPTEKTSVVSWGACRTLDKLESSLDGWHHIAYLDTLPHLKPEHLQALHGTVSVDMCRVDHNDTERNRIFACLPFVDYLIIGCEESCSLMGPDGSPLEAAKALGAKSRGWAILHGPAGSVASNGVTVVQSETQWRDITNVLGAGDYFAAGFIASESESVAYRIVNGHKMAGTLLA